LHNDTDLKKVYRSNGHTSIMFYNISTVSYISSIPGISGKMIKGKIKRYKFNLSLLV